MFTLRGKVQTPGGKPITTGTLVFYPIPGVFTTDDGAVVIQQEAAPIGPDGSVEVVLEWKPGLVYQARLAGAVGLPTFSFPAPEADGAVVDLADVVPQRVPAGLDPALYVKGEPGDPGAAGTGDDAYVAALVTNPDTATGASLNSTFALKGEAAADPVAPLVAKLDQRAPSAVIAVLGDSTGVPPTTGKWVDSFASKIGAKWQACKVTTRLQSSLVYPAPTIVASGSLSKTVAADTFSRTAADLKGTQAETGGVWTSTSTGKYSVDGSKAVFINGSTGVTAQRVPTLSAGRLSTTVAWSIIYDGGAHVGAYMTMSSYVDASNFLWIDVKANVGSIDFKKSTTAGGTVIVSTATFAQAGITANLSAQNLTTKIEHIGNTVVYTVGSATYTHTMTQAESDLFATATSGGFWGTTNDHSVDTITITAGAPAATTLDIYNGSASSTDATWPLTRLDQLLPVAPDVVFINYGHNHTTEDPATFEGKVDDLVNAVRAKYAGTPIVIVGQNPEKAPATNRAFHNAREAAKRAWCKTKGYGYLPGYEAFLGKDFPDDYIQPDGVHPTVSGTSDGGALWGQAALDYLARQSLKPGA